MTIMTNFGGDGQHLYSKVDMMFVQQTNKQLNKQTKTKQNYKHVKGYLFDVIAKGVKK